MRDSFAFFKVDYFLIYFLNRNDATRFAVFFDIPGDSERFRMLYVGHKNGIKITGLRRSNIYRLYVRAIISDPRRKDVGSFTAFATTPEPRLNDSVHQKHWLAYSNPKLSDEAIMTVPSFRAAMWSRKFCQLANGGEEKLELLWKHYKYIAKDLSWTEVNFKKLDSIIKHNLGGDKFLLKGKEIDQTSDNDVEPDEDNEIVDNDFHSTIKEAQRFGSCWSNPDCIPCSIGCLHLCQAPMPLIYWLCCDICGSDIIMKTPVGNTLVETLTSRHPWIRGHFNESHSNLLGNVPSSEDYERCYGFVTGIVIDADDGVDDRAGVVGNIINRLRPSDNARYCFDHY